MGIIMTSSRRTILTAGLMLALTAAGAMAQTPPTTIRGSITGLDGSTLSIATREGPTIKMMLPEGFKPTALKRMSMSDIGPNTYVATVASPEADGTLKAAYVQIFPEALRGTGEGHYDWDLAPGTTMTNATVTSMVSANAGRKLTMVYKGTPIDITVPEGTLIITGIPAEVSDLKPGAKVFARGVKNADGTYTAQRIAVSKDGVNPPQ
jgi:hypothetical protein